MLTDRGGDTRIELEKRKLPTVLIASANVSLSLSGIQQLFVSCFVRTGHKKVNRLSIQRGAGAIVAASAGTRTFAGVSKSSNLGKVRQVSVQDL